MITREIFARRRIAIWGLRSARIKKLKKTDPNFFSKKMWIRGSIETETKNWIKPSWGNSADQQGQGYPAHNWSSTDHIAKPGL